METVLYEYDVTDATTRMRRLQQACLTFVAEPQTRRQVRLIGLLVPLPAFSDFAQPSRRDARRGVRPAGRGPGVAARRGHSRLQAQARRRGVTLRCATEVERRLRQARRDARRLARWLRRTRCRDYGYDTNVKALPPSPSACHDEQASHSATANVLSLPVLVIGLLAPQTHKDIALLHAWQHALEAQHTSPLRHAHVLQLSFMHMAQFVRDTAVSWGVRLAECLLSHQSMLLDLTCCLLLDGNVTQTSAKDKTAFLREVLPRLVPAKGRCALMLAYSRLLPSICGEAIQSTAMLTLLHQQLRELYAELHGTGHGYSWPLCLSYAGSVESLQRGLVAIPAGRCRTKTAAPRAGPVMTVASLLQTRALRDVYALTSLLLGYDQADLYASAVTFYTGVLHRLQSAYCLGLIAPLVRPPQTSASRAATRARPDGRKRLRTHDAAAQPPATQPRRRRVEAVPDTPPPPLTWEESV